MSYLVNPFSPLAAPEKIWGLSVDNIQVLRDNPRRVAFDVMRLFMSVKVPITVWGPVGSRKTRTIQALSREHSPNDVPYQVITIQPSTMDATIIHGMFYTSLNPVTGETVMHRSMPEVVQQVVSYFEEHDGYTIMYLDELTTCHASVQHALLGLLTHAIYGDINLSEYITVVMAANPEGTVSTVIPLGEQVLNRGGHVAWFGDVDLFIDDWSSGFGSPERAPIPEIEALITTMLQSNRGKAFRSSSWDPEKLVPYDQIEHSERTTTDLATVLTRVYSVFENVPDAVRQYYVGQVTLALQGPDWKDTAFAAMKLLERNVTPRTITATVNRSGITENTTTTEFQDALGSSLHHATRTGNGFMTHDQVQEMAEQLYRLATKSTDYEPYLTCWAFLVGGPTEAAVMATTAIMMQLLVLGRDRVNSQIFQPNQVTPAFVPQNVRDYLRSMMSRV